MSADEKDAAAGRPVDRTGSAAAAGPDCEAQPAASAGLVGEPVFAAVKSEPAAAELVNGPCSFAVEPVGEAWFEAAVKSLDESCFAAAAAPVGEPCPASGPQAEIGPVGEEQAEDLKCFEWHTVHCEGS